MAATKTKKKTYYFPGQKGRLRLNIVDKNGEYIPKLHQNQPMFKRNGEPIYQQYSIEVPACFMDPSRPTFGKYITDKVDEISQLDLMAMNPKSGVISEEEFKDKHAHLLYTQAETKVALSAKDNLIADLKARLAKYEKK